MPWRCAWTERGCWELCVNLTKELAARGLLWRSQQLNKDMRNFAVIAVAHNEITSCFLKGSSMLQRLKKQNSKNSKQVLHLKNTARVRRCLSLSSTEMMTHALSSHKLCRLSLWMAPHHFLTWCLHAENILHFFMCVQECGIGCLCAWIYTCVWVSGGGEGWHFMQHFMFETCHINTPRWRLQERSKRF